MSNPENGGADRAARARWMIAELYKQADKMVGLMEFWRAGNQPDFP